MKQTALGLILTVTALCILACQSSISNNSSPSTNSNTSINVAPKSEPSSSPNTSAANSTASTSTPLDVLNAWWEAIKNRDYEAYKKTVSSTVLQHARVWESLIGAPKNFLPMPFKLRNEHIDANEASYEIRDFRGEWRVVYLIKENGEWRVNSDHPDFPY